MTAPCITDPAEWRAALDGHRAAGRDVGVVLTMGALHAGHLSLIRRAAGLRDVVTVTDYVNPLQFGAGDDLAAYPRDVEQDAKLAASAGADLLFAPSPEQLWPGGQATTVRVGGVGERLEGHARPGHFDGVATIVAKLLALCGACWAFFGEKDWQQLALVRRLVADLSLPAEIVGCPTVRDVDGLALSSRNAYLDERQRAVAPALYHALLAGRRAVEGGERDPDSVERAMAEVLAGQPAFALDYVAVADPDDLSPLRRVAGQVRLLGAARLGRARLIDNLDAVSPHPRGD